MKALVYNKNSENKIELCERNIPQILDSKDAIVEVTLSSICTSDLHIINGQVPRANNNIILGHEFVGKVIEIGADVKNIKIGNRVSANCETFCGECYFCKQGYINNCENGGWELGCRIDGCQAEYVRVPYADMGLTQIPDNVTDKNALFVGDILSSGYFGAEMCEIKPGDTIAVIGSGPVGMCSMICARLMGAEKIIAIDINQNRLNIAKQQNLADFYLNPNNSDIEDEVKKLTNNRGADGVIEAAGCSPHGVICYQQQHSFQQQFSSAGGENIATDSTNSYTDTSISPFGGIRRQQPQSQRQQGTFELAWKIARPNAIIGIVAMYEENQVLPLPQMYGKNLTFKTGGVDAIHCKKLLQLISEGKINTDFLVTQTYPLKDILDAYSYFKNNKDTCLKVAITK